jgi:hypothetical protein
MGVVVTYKLLTQGAVTIWKRRTVCIDRLKVQRREKEKDLRYIQALAPAAVTVYQIYNMSLAHVHL